MGVSHTSKFILWRCLEDTFETNWMNDGAGGRHYSSSFAQHSGQMVQKIHCDRKNLMCFHVKCTFTEWGHVSFVNIIVTLECIAIIVSLPDDLLHRLYYFSIRMDPYCWEFIFPTVKIYNWWGGFHERSYSLVCFSLNFYLKILWIRVSIGLIIFLESVFGNSKFN